MGNQFITALTAIYWLLTYLLCFNKMANTY